MVTVIGTGLSETVENRRNFYRNPINQNVVGGLAGGNFAYAVGTVAQTHEVAAGWQNIIVTAISANGRAGYRTTVPLTGATLGVPINFRVLRASLPAGVRARLYVDASGPGAQIVGHWDGFFGASSSLSGTIIPTGEAVSLSWYVWLEPISGSFSGSVTFGTAWGLVEVGAPLGEAFTGSSAPVSPYSYTWAGTPHNSASIEWLTRDIQVVPRLVDGFEASREIRNIVHPVLNKSNPDVTLRAPGLRSGEFRCLFESQADALAAFARLSVPQVFTISDPETPAIDMSFVVGTVGGSGELSIELDDETRTVWWVVVPFVEVIV